MYEQTLWQDHVTEFEDRYTESGNDDGTITHTPVEGEIIQQGTPQNATNFNHMENGISNATEVAALVAPGTVGTLKIDRTSASDATLRINTSVTTQTTDSNDTSQPFKDVKAASGVSIPQILIAAGLFPDSAQTTPGRFWARNNGERLPLRGSGFNNASVGGAGALNLYHPRSSVHNSVSFRSAFVE